MDRMKIDSISNYFQSVLVHRKMKRTLKTLIFFSFSTHFLWLSDGEVWASGTGRDFSYFVTQEETFFSLSILMKKYVDDRILKIKNWSFFTTEKSLFLFFLPLAMFFLQSIRIVKKPALDSNSVQDHYKFSSIVEQRHAFANILSIRTSFNSNSNENTALEIHFH